MKSFSCIVVLFAILLGCGCSVSTPTTTRSELGRLGGKGPIRILTVDSSLYVMESFSFDDSVLTGKGTVKHRLQLEVFEGSIPFSRMLFIERQESNFWKAAVVIPLGLGVFGGFAQAIGNSSKFEIRRPRGSCPSISSFDGKNFVLEGEAFGTSVSRSLEGRTSTVLASLVPTHDHLTVRVSNDRPETHLINHLQLMAGDAKDACSVVLDVDDVLWPVVHSLSPSAARDHSGNEILQLLESSDGNFGSRTWPTLPRFRDFRTRSSLSSTCRLKKVPERSSSKP